MKYRVRVCLNNNEIIKKSEKSHNQLTQFIKNWSKKFNASMKEMAKKVNLEHKLF